MISAGSAKNKKPATCAEIAQTAGHIRSYFLWFAHLSVSYMIGMIYSDITTLVSSGTRRRDTPESVRYRIPMFRQYYTISDDPISIPVNILI